MPNILEMLYVRRIRITFICARINTQKIEASKEKVQLVGSLEFSVELFLVSVIYRKTINTNDNERLLMHMKD